MLHTLADHLSHLGSAARCGDRRFADAAVGAWPGCSVSSTGPEAAGSTAAPCPAGGLALFFGILVRRLRSRSLGRDARLVLAPQWRRPSVRSTTSRIALVEKLGVRSPRPRSGGLRIWVHRFTFPILGIHTLPDWIGMPLSVLWIVAIMNMVNFLDGLDGLATGFRDLCVHLHTDRALAPAAEVQVAILSAIVLGAALGSCATTSIRPIIMATRARCCSVSCWRRSAPGLLKTASIVTLFFRCSCSPCDHRHLIRRGEATEVQAAVYVADRSTSTTLREHRLLAAARRRLHLALVRHTGGHALACASSATRARRVASLADARRLALGWSPWRLRVHGVLLEIVKLANR